MDFLYSRNRLNVATSRARCVAVVVGSPDLWRVRARTPEQMRLANAFCRFVEMAARLRRGRPITPHRGPDARSRLRSRPIIGGHERGIDALAGSARCRSPSRTWTLVGGRRARQHRAHRRRHGRGDRRRGPRRDGAVERRHRRRGRPRGGGRRDRCLARSWSAAGAGSASPPGTPSAVGGALVATAAVIATSLPLLLVGIVPHRVRQHVQPAVALRRGGPATRTRGGPRPSGSSSGARRSGRSSVRTSWRRPATSPRAIGPARAGRRRTSSRSCSSGRRRSCRWRSSAPIRTSSPTRRRGPIRRRTRPSPCRSRSVLRRPHVPVAIVALVTGQVVMVLIMTMTPLHMTEHGHTSAAVGIVISGHTFGMFALSPMSGPPDRPLRERAGRSWPGWSSSPVSAVLAAAAPPEGGRAPVPRPVPARLRLEPGLRGGLRAADDRPRRSPSGRGSRA